MAENITFGLGGYCENCDASHDHPLNNIVEVLEVEELIVTVDAKASALAKLEALGLTEDDIKAILL